MKTYNIHEAKTHLSKILKDVEAGKSVQIARKGKVIAEVHPPRGRPLKLGLLKGGSPIDWESWDAMDNDIRREFEASTDRPLFEDS